MGDEKKSARHNAKHSKVHKTYYTLNLPPYHLYE